MFYDVVFGSGPLGVAIWLGLFCVSTTALAFILMLLFSIRKSAFRNVALLEQLTSGDENLTPEQLSKKDSLFDHVYEHICANSHKPKAELEENISEIIGRESRGTLRKTAMLQTCANIAPMLGLLGTVQGMVTAFMGLGTSMGPEKASVLAVSISQALYTTAAGLVIAIPATVLCIIFRNKLEKYIDSLNEDIEKLIDFASVSGE